MRRAARSLLLCVLATTAPWLVTGTAAQVCDLTYGEGSLIWPGRANWEIRVYYEDCGTYCEHFSAEKLTDRIEEAYCAWKQRLPCPGVDFTYVVSELGSGPAGPYHAYVYFIDYNDFPDPIDGQYALITQQYIALDDSTGNHYSYAWASAVATNPNLLYPALQGYYWTFGASPQNGTGGQLTAHFLGGMTHEAGRAFGVGATWGSCPDGCTDYCGQLPTMIEQVDPDCGYGGVLQNPKSYYNCQSAFTLSQSDQDAFDRLYGGWMVWKTSEVEGFGLNAYCGQVNPICGMVTPVLTSIAEARWNGSVLEVDVLIGDERVRVVAVVGSGEGRSWERQVSGERVVDGLRRYWVDGVDQPVQEASIVLSDGEVLGPVEVMDVRGGAEWSAYPTVARTGCRIHLRGVRGVAVEWKIFSVAGKLVYEGVDDGTGEALVWGGRDRAGRGVSDGIYLIRVVEKDSRRSFVTRVAVCN